MNKSILGLALGAALLMTGAASAADVNMINLDPAGVGLNDATPVSPIGGNPGKTRGEQARIVYRFAMDMWGGVLESPVDINVYASFAPLACTSTSGTLASAGANDLWLLNDGVTDRVYGAALAEALIGENLSDPADPGDIVSRFNGNLGAPGCLDGMEWYFGLDGNTPAGKVNFLNVVMHEIGHGLGVQGFVYTQNTTFLGYYTYGYSDPYTYNAYDTVLNKRFEAMTNAERKVAMSTPGRTVWTGPNVNYNASLILDRRNALRPTAPAAIAGRDYEVGYAAFGPLATPANFPDRALVLVDDGNSTANGGVGTTSDGCSANGAATTAGDTIVYANAAAVAGKVAVIDRGTCSFEYKAKIAQDNGAVGVIIVNNAAGVIDMAVGAPPTTGLTIPTVMISQADGTQLKANLTGASAGMVLSNLKAGTDGAGRTRLYTPSTLAPGSTYSHFDTVLSPDALMEPFDSEAVQANYTADLTPALFADIGWTLNPGNGKLFKGICDTGVDAVADGGLVLGSNVQAYNNVCSIGATRTTYYNCMNAHATKLQGIGLISSTQKSKILTCARRVSDNWGR